MHGGQPRLRDRSDVGAPPRGGRLWPDEVIQPPKKPVWVPRSFQALDISSGVSSAHPVENFPVPVLITITIFLIAAVIAEQ